MKPLNRILSWVLLILLTLIFVLFPVKLSNEYHNIQGPYIFSNLAVFSILFYIWVLLLTLLLFQNNIPKNPSWEHLALSVIFGLCFIGFWSFITPLGSYADSLYNMGHVRYLNEFGTIPLMHPNLGYFDFPGMHLLVSGISQTTGLNIFQSQTIYLLFIAAIVPSLFYLLFIGWIKNSRLAFFGTVVGIMIGGVLIDKIRVFTPATLGITLLLVFLIFYNKSKNMSKDIILLIFIFLAIVISYFSTPFLLLLVFAGVGLIYFMGKQKIELSLLFLVLLFLVVFTSWEIYWTWNTFRSLSSFFPHIISDLVNGEFIRAIVGLAPSNIGTEVPLWTNIVRLFGWGLLAISTFLGLSNLFFLKKLNPEELYITGGLMGVLFLSVIGFFGTAAGTQFVRYLLFAPIFASPLLITFLVRSHLWGRRILIGIIIVVIILSLPSFLSAVNTVSTDAIYSYDLSPGIFIENNSSIQGKNIAFFRVSNVSAAWIFYYSPSAQIVDMSELAYYDKNVFWQKVEDINTAFENSQITVGKQKIFIIDEKVKIIPEKLGISINDIGWERLLESLSTTNLFFNNGHVQLYTP